MTEFKTRRRAGRTARLASALLADRTRETAESIVIITCIACGRDMLDVDEFRQALLLAEVRILAHHRQRPGRPQFRP